MGPMTRRLAALLLAGTLAAGPVQAANEPFDIFSDSWTADGIEDVTVFIGNVEFRQGRLLIRAEIARFLGVEGLDTTDFERAVFTGVPVYFRQEAEDGTVTEGRAREIDYQAEEEHLSLRGEAWVRQGRQQLTAARIEYSVARDRIVSAGRLDEEEDGERVHFRSVPEEEREDNGS